MVYTDSQNIIGLPGRRDALEQNEYLSAKGKRLNNYKLYQAFYALTDRIDCDFIKVKGHSASKFKDDMDRIFALVDRASRKALKDFNR